MHMAPNSSKMKQIPFPFSPPAQRHSKTSVAAASSVVPQAASLRAQVLAALQRADPAGLTDEELQGALQMQANTERPRRIELVKAGFVRDSGQTRKTSSGRRASVWCCTPLGLQQ